MTTINNAVNQPTIQTIQPKKEEQPKETKKGISTTTKVVVGTGLAALAAVGIYVATKGKSISGLKGIVKDAGNHAVLPLSEFKTQGCKFVKGKAFMPDGKPFNGMIKTKNGGFMIYENGLLQQSVIKKNKYVPGVTKKYTYDADNRVVEVLREQVHTTGSTDKTTTRFKRAWGGKISSIERTNKPEISFEYGTDGKGNFSLNKMVETVRDKFDRKSRLFYDEQTTTECIRDAAGKTTVKKHSPQKVNFHEPYEVNYND